MCLEQGNKNSHKVIVLVAQNILIQRRIQNPVKYLKKDLFAKIIEAVRNMVYFIFSYLLALRFLISLKI